MMHIDWTLLLMSSPLILFIVWILCAHLVRLVRGSPEEIEERNVERTVKERGVSRSEARSIVEGERFRNEGKVGNFFTGLLVIALLVGLFLLGYCRGNWGMFILIGGGLFFLWIGVWAWDFAVVRNAVKQLLIALVFAAICYFALVFKLGCVRNFGGFW